MTTTITVISDTHCQKWHDLHPKIRQSVKESDIAIHCGDIVKEDVVKGFIKESKKSFIVHGNSDPVELRNILPYIETITIEKVAIGIIHPAWGTEEFPVQELLNDFPAKPDMILFGHTHEPYNQINDGVLYVNPGQAYKSFMVDCTIAKIIIDGENIAVEIILIE
jgi:putative phosphoesterase